MRGHDRLNDIRRRISEMTANNNRTPPRSSRNAEAARAPPISPNNRGFLLDDDDEATEVEADISDESEIETIPTFKFQQPRNPSHAPPRPPRPDTIHVEPAKMTREATIDRNGNKTAKQTEYEGNLPYMSRIADHQYADTKDARRTYERLYDKSEERAYKNASEQRAAAERMYNEAENRRYNNKREVREAQLEKQRMYYENQEKARQAELARLEEENRIKREESIRDFHERHRIKTEEFLRKRREEDLKREELRKQREAEEERKEMERFRREVDEEIRRQENEAKLKMAQMDYKDRANERYIDKSAKLEEQRMKYADKRDERIHDERKQRLYQAKELADIHNDFMDRAQERYFKGVAFRDARVRNHRDWVKIDKENKGIERERELEDIFEEMGLGNPYYYDFTEPMMSADTRRLVHAGRRGYEYSVLFTGVENIFAKGNDTYVEFLNGNIKPLPKYEDGYNIVYKRLVSNVWIVDVYKYPKSLNEPMYRREEKDNCNIQ